MNHRIHPILKAGLTAAVAVAAMCHLEAAPGIRRLTPPSMLFSFNDPGTPITSRFLPGQRFDLQATVSPDAGQSITAVTFLVDGSPVAGTVTLADATVAGLPAGTKVATLRAYSNAKPGVHILTATAVQSDSTVNSAQGNFEVVGIGQVGRRAKNVIILIGDGMGIAHRTAARVVQMGAQQGKANALLAMDQFPYTGLVMTHSLNSIVTDSAPGAACYSTGNKNNNNQEGVFPDDTLAKFDNPRTENVGEYLHRTQGKSLGIVTTADVFDATPAAFAVHTQDRGAGTGICDQYLDERNRTGLTVLLGGGRKWFLPSTTPGSARADASDYALPAELAAGWGVPAGTLDKNRDLLGEFTAAGFTYVPDRTALKAIPANTTRLLGLFSLSNMNVTRDKVDKQRGVVPAGATQPVVDDYGFPDQPMLDEMADKALSVLSKNPNGFVLMVEGASIDKQAHNMDTDRWILETIEFDKAVARCRAFAEQNPDTLVVVTADHECAGINIIGSSRVNAATLASQAANPSYITNVFSNTVGGVATKYTNVISTLRTNVGTYDLAGFPVYPVANDGYPSTMDPDFKMLVGYAASADRFEDYVSNPYPLQDSQQPAVKVAPLNGYPKEPVNRDVAGGTFITGQVNDSTAVHTASDIPVSAFGRGAAAFTGVMDNTDVFFRAMQAVLGGAR